MIDVALAVVQRDARLLFLRRDREPMRGMWELPGGKVERGETPEQCAARELAEETGLRAVATRALGVVAHEYPWGGVRLFAVACDAPGEPTVGTWRPREAWASVDVLPGTRAIIQTLFPNGVTPPWE